MSQNIVEKAENDNGVLMIIQDDDVQSPRRDFDNLGTMVCWHNRYTLGDEHQYEDARAFLEDLVFEFEDLEEDYVYELKDSELMDIINNHAVILPLYLYDHSGLTINTTGFSCGWDSGQVGWIYVTNDDIVSEFGSPNVNNARNCLIGEVETYDQYLTGDVYGFVIEDHDGNHIDSCWGFYGLQAIKSELSSYIGADYIELVNELA